MTKVRSTREQVRAQSAYVRIEALLSESPAWIKDYGRQSLRLPALIHHCGLCQALAFLESKSAGEKGEAYRRLLSDLATVSGLGGLASEARGADIAKYIRMTQEAIASAEWLKRYAEALGLTEPKKAAQGKK